MDRTEVFFAAVDKLKLSPQEIVTFEELFDARLDLSQSLRRLENTEEYGNLEEGRAYQLYCEGEDKYLSLLNEAPSKVRQAMFLCFEVCDSLAE